MKQMLNIPAFPAGLQDLHGTTCQYHLVDWPPRLSVSDGREGILTLSSDPTTDTQVTLRGSNSASATPRVPFRVHTHPDSAHLLLCTFRKGFFETAPAILTPG